MTESVIRTRVTICSPGIPTYRHALFESIRGQTPLAIHAAYSPEPVNGIPQLSPSAFDDFTHLETKRLFGLMWQRGVIKLVVSDDSQVFIFTGEVKVISTWVASLILKARGKPVLFWTIGWHRPDKGLRKLIRLCFYSLADRLLLYGDGALRIGRSHGFPTSRMAVIHNSVGAQPGSGASGFASAELKRALATRKPIIGAVIRLNRVKRLDLLIHAAALIRARGTDVRVILVGDGPARHQLISDATHRGVDLVVVPPLYSDDELQPLYAQMAVTVVPAAVGLTAIQSLRFGVPVISDDDVFSQMPEWEAIVPARTGARYEAGSAESLSIAIERWIGLMKDARGSVRQSCLDEVNMKWNPGSQASKIAASVFDALGM